MVNKKKSGGFGVNKGWVFLIIVTLLPTSVHAVITGSKHDLSGTFLTTTNQICIFCHTPHNANTTVTAAPLWNHTESAVGSYTLYDTLEFIGCVDAGVVCDQATEQPRASTKLCLSCHDGTIAVDSYGGMTGSVNMPGTQGSANLGTDLSDDHPVSVKWDHQTVVTGGGICTGCHFPGAGNLTGVEFFGGYVECASCHDVHNNTPWPTMLNLPINGEDSTENSALCLRCHEMSTLVTVTPP